MNNIKPVPSLHKACLKRVLLSAKESGCSITQIGITDSRADGIAKIYVHDDMQKEFYVMSGELGTDGCEVMKIGRAIQ